MVGKMWILALLICFSGNAVHALEASGNSLLSKQVELINRGLKSGEITEETRDFFLQSLFEMQNKSERPKSDAIGEFTRLVHEGIASGEITAETRDFFLNAVDELNRNR